MKTASFSGLYGLLITAMLICCNKPNNQPVTQAENPPVTLSDMTECHRTASWDSVKIQSRLLGRWEWEYIQCYWNPENGNSKDFQGLSVEFKPDNTLEVKLNGETTQTSTWELVNLNDGYYKVQVKPLVLQLPGRILFCTERVLFNDSYTDGCDNYFKRLN
jgi:hypothetical protein